jgi:parvulin-like peptidyl-prolyl isomerase
MMVRRLVIPLVLSLACMLGVAALHAEVIEQVLVRVNGEILTLTDFEKRQIAELQSRAEELGNLPPNDPKLARAVAESVPRLILGAVDELLLMQRARENGWALTEARFQEILKDIREQNKLEDDEAFRKALQAEGLTEADMRAGFEREMLIRQIRQVEVIDKISVTEQEERAYYDANLKEFTTPGEVTLREILVEVPAGEGPARDAAEARARTTAEETRARLAAGEPFPRLAGEVSASGSKANGGLVGPLQVEKLVPELQKAIAALEVGGLSEVVRTPRGYQIIRLESRSETRVRPFDEVRGEVSRRLAEQKGRGEMLRYLERLRAQANIVWRHDELKRAYEKALADRRATLEQEQAAAQQS